jgi:N-acylglucosamine-6-phosphate 2-epimerase
MHDVTDAREILHPGLIVSCHGDENETYHSPELILAFAKAAELGGAIALRIEGVATVERVRPQTALPLIAFIKGTYADQSELITPDLSDIDALFAAGADIVALDITQRKRPNGLDGFDFLEEARKRFPKPLWADCSTFREGVRAAELGVDYVASTLSGHTPDTEHADYHSPDIELVHGLSDSLTIPVIAEGRIWTPADALQCMAAGAYAVVVGSAITRPRLITQMFASALKHVS